MLKFCWICCGYISGMYEMFIRSIWLRLEGFVGFLLYQIS